MSREQTNLRIQEWLVRHTDRAAHTVVLDDLRGSFSIRSGGLDPAHVELIAQSGEQSLPAIVVHQSTMRIIDGVHRVQAARLSGGTAITAEYFDGTDGEAHALSVFLNVGHGLPLARRDRTAAARALLGQHPEWSDRFLGRMAGLSHGTVATIRRSVGERGESSGRLGRDGRIRPLDVSARRLQAAQLLKENPELSLRDVARRVGISTSTAADVKARLGSGRHPVPTRDRQPDGPGLPDPGEKPVDVPPDVTAGGSGAEGATDNQPNRHDVELLSAPMLNVLLERLKKDPAVRFSETGRELIRQLAATQDSFGRVQLSAGTAPAHCSTTLAQIARSYATAWKVLAERVESRTIEMVQGQQSV